MQEPFIKIPRRILESQEWQNGHFDRAKAEVDLLGLARFTAGYIYIRGVRVPVKPGQIAIAEDSLAQRWQWSRGKVRRFLDELQECGVIEQQKNRLISIISIIGRARNTSSDTTSKTTDELQTEHLMIQDLHKSEKEEWKRKKEKKPSRGGTADDDFDIFWSLWPKKEDKDQARKVWRNLSTSDRAKVFEAVKIQMLPGRALNPGDRKFIPGPAKWLRNKRFEDEVQTTAVMNAEKCPLKFYDNNFLANVNGNLRGGVRQEHIHTAAVNQDDFASDEIPSNLLFCCEVDTASKQYKSSIGYKYLKYELCGLVEFPDGDLILHRTGNPCPFCHSEAALHV